MPCSSPLPAFEERGTGHIRVFGGGVIVPDEIHEIEGYGVSKIFSPDDGRRMGPQGRTNHMLELCNFSPERDLEAEIERLKVRDIRAFNTLITQANRRYTPYWGGGLVRERIRAMGR